MDDDTEYLYIHPPKLFGGNPKHTRRVVRFELLNAGRRGDNEWAMWVFFDTTIPRDSFASLGFMPSLEAAVAVCRKHTSGVPIEAYQWRGGRKTRVDIEGQAQPSDLPHNALHIDELEKGS